MDDLRRLLGQMGACEYARRIARDFDAVERYYECVHEIHLEWFIRRYINSRKKDEEYRREHERYIRQGNLRELFPFPRVLAMAETMWREYQMKVRL